MTTLDENLRMIYDSVHFLRSKKMEVIYDAEHFFDGWRANPDYAIAAITAAHKAGASNLSLCDTNGGSLPVQIHEAFAAVRRALPRAALGIHAHNDSGCAVANSVAAVEAGAVLVQGVVNGFGERCGNADLTTMISEPQAQDELQRGDGCTAEVINRNLLAWISEVANMVPNDKQPYVGNSAFAPIRAACMCSAVSRHASTYEHIDPTIVGNQRRILVSELSGKSNVLMKHVALRGQ